MELRNLKTFRVAAQLLNFTKAAKELNFSQPTVTAQIRMLEKEIGQPLFFRIGKRTYLTSQGRIVKDYADQIFAMLEKMHQELAEQNEPAPGKLTIAASETFCTYYFPSIIRKFLGVSPEMRIRLVSCQSNEVISGIENNAYDIGIISGSLQKSGITSIVISEEEDLIMIVSRKLHNKYTVDKLLSQFPFIRYEIAGPFDRQIQRYINDAGISPGKIIESSSLEAVKSTVMKDIGIGLISRNLVSQELSDHELYEIVLNKQPVKIQTSLIIATSKLMNEQTMNLIRIIQQNWHASR